MSARNAIGRLTRDASGTTAVEFALVAPVFFMLVIGSINLALCLFTLGSMHFAVEDAARCASIQTTVCKDSASTIAFAEQRLFSDAIAVEFTHVAAACGNQVTASGAFELHTGVSTLKIPLSATNCFP